MTLSLKHPITCLITPGLLTDESYSAAAPTLLRTLEFAVEVHVTLIQIREKRLSARNLFSLAQAANSLTNGSNTKVLINDRVDIALAARCAGVHLSYRSLPAATVKKTFRDAITIGVSVHNEKEIDAARAAGASYAMFGPVFPTPGKGEPAGISRFKSACGVAGPLPLIGVGGIGPGNFREVIEAGAAGFAAIRAMNDATFLSDVVAKL